MEFRKPLRSGRGRLATLASDPLSRRQKEGACATARAAPRHEAPRFPGRSTLTAADQQPLASMAYNSSLKVRPAKHCLCHAPARGVRFRVVLSFAYRIDHTVDEFGSSVPEFFEFA
jgi:hypothetical protein